MLPSLGTEPGLHVPASLAPLAVVSFTTKLFFAITIGTSSFCPPPHTWTHVQDLFRAQVTERELPAKLFNLFFPSLCVLICGMVEEVLSSDCFLLGYF